MKILLSLISVVIGFALIGCSSKPEKKEDAGPYAGYKTTPTGLKYLDIVVGSGEEPKKGDKIIVDYVGTLEDGKEFDRSNKNNHFVFTLGLGEVIKGWDEGLSTMRVGGKRKLVIPPELGYGSRGASGLIPPNATLLFEVELIGIKGK